MLTRPFLSRFAKDSRAVGTVEFVVALPLALFLMLGGYETANYVRVSLRLEMAANSIAEMISQSPANAAASVASNGLVTHQQLHFFYDSTMYTLPDSLTEAAQQGVNWQDITTVSTWSVEFKPNSANCGATCTYTPVVVWSFNGGPPCGAQIQESADDAVVTPLTLPSSVYGPGSLLVVQVKYKYYPTFGASWFGASTLTRTAMMAPRNVDVVESNDTADHAANCPNTPF